VAQAACSNQAVPVAVEAGLPVAGHPKPQLQQLLELPRVVLLGAEATPAGAPVPAAATGAAAHRDALAGAAEVLQRDVEARHVDASSGVVKHVLVLRLPPRLRRSQQLLRVPLPRAAPAEWPPLRIGRVPLVWSVCLLRPPR